MNVHLRDARDFLVSLKLTIVLLAAGMGLIFAATLEQADLGVWAVQQKYIRSFVVYAFPGGFPVPAFPGGYSVGLLLLLNLLAAHAARFTWAARKTGVLLIHAGLVLLLVGELLGGLWQRDYQLRFAPGESRAFAGSDRFYELAIADTTAADHDDVTAIPASLLPAKVPLTPPSLPFQIEVRAYYPNSTLQAQTAAGPVATQNADTGIIAVPQPVTFNAGESNVPAAYVELSGNAGRLGPFLLSPAIGAPQTFAYAGRTWQMEFRAQRSYFPFSLRLLEFRHEQHPGTDIPRLFASRVRLRDNDGREDREVEIAMNQPLRHGGWTFYQADAADNGRTSVLQVVRNPSWWMPYLACGLVASGLLVQFGIHLLGFIRRRSASGVTAGPLDPPSTAWSPRIIGGLAAAAVTAIVFTPLWRPAPAARPFDLATVGELPALADGRAKPLDTVARSSLLLLQGGERVTDAAGRSVSPTAWLLDGLFRTEIADTYPVIAITHPDLLTVMGLTPAPDNHFSLRQLRAGRPQLDIQAQLAVTTPPRQRTSFQRAALQLRTALERYERLQRSANAPGVDQFLTRLVASPATLDPDLATACRVIDGVASLRLVPNARAGADEWLTAGAAWSTEPADPVAVGWARLGKAWQEQDASAMNVAGRELHDRLAERRPAITRAATIEARFNAAAPFRRGLLPYLGAFVLGTAWWLTGRSWLRRGALVLAGAGFLITTTGVVVRMWLEGRPPVTNLYSSALFVGWVAVALCLAVELGTRHGFAVVAGAVVGFSSLLIAHYLSLAGDTLEAMRAVLDSNFWLATHVVSVTTGYAATFLAGMFGLSFVFRGALTRGLTPAAADALTRATYGVICFATLFSFVGTTLGGMWADQSWGRFWGWDPKENGALLIVLWNAVILHARWGGFIRQRGLAALAIGGNIVTAWSWFGVNMLGVGLHSYGFMPAAFWWLVGFGVTQALAIGLALVPLRYWRSFPLPVSATGAQTLPVIANA